MTVALWCILIALLLNPLCALIAKASSGRFGLKDNHDPRAFLDTLSGLPRRAHAAEDVGLGHADHHAQQGHQRADPEGAPEDLVKV